MAGVEGTAGLGREEAPARESGPSGRPPKSGALRNSVCTVELPAPAHFLRGRCGLCDLGGIREPDKAWGAQIHLVKVVKVGYFMGEHTDVYYRSAPEKLRSPMARTPEDLTQRIVFTTGEAAKVCNVSQQTIIRCFDAGRLTGFRVPGSRSRRIPRESLVRFMQDNGIDPGVLSREPISSSNPRRVMLVTEDVAMARVMQEASRGAGVEVRIARNSFEAGFMVGQERPDVVMVDAAMVGAAELCRHVMKDEATRGVHVTGVIGDAAPETAEGVLRAAGVSEIVRVRMAHEGMIEVLRGVGALRG